MESKAELRRRIAALAAALDLADRSDRSARIGARLLTLPEFRGAGTVFLPVSFGAEPDTRGIIQKLLDQGAVVAVPRIAGKGIMEAHRIRSLGDLAPGRFGIPAPVHPDPLEGTPVITVCPGVAFGSGGERLGRGKAYYDRFLAAHPGTFAVGICFEVQLAEGIPMTPEDRRMAAVVTEARVLRPRAIP
jgi:5-formyltetrahydrofolate cyclo-ligase